MSLSASTTIEIPFHDIDIMHIVWHGHYVKYFEIARTKLMKNIGLDWPYLREIGIAMPITSLNINYKQSVNYEHQMRVKAIISNYEYPSLEVSYFIQTDQNDKPHIIGSTKQVYMSIEQNKALFKVPEIILEKYRSFDGQ